MEEQEIGGAEGMGCHSSTHLRSSHPPRPTATSMVTVSTEKPCGDSQHLEEAKI